MDLLKLAIIEAAHQNPGLSKHELGLKAVEMLGSEGFGNAVTMASIDGLMTAKYLIRLDFEYYLTPSGNRHRNELVKQLKYLSDKVQL